jgi:cysteinyl-tRNA synthetase
VAGNGVVTVRRRGRSTTYGDGAVVTLDALGALLRGEEAGGPPPVAGAGGAADVTAGNGPAPPSLRAEAQAARAAFDAALAARDVDGCVAAVLDLDGAIVAWSSDTDVDDADLARRTLRAMIVTLGDLARDGARDPRDVLGPLVTALVELRARAREARDWATSDLVRDRLAAAGVELRDTPAGPEWHLGRA